ncbi:MAG: class I SAM-dependent methyltransferase [Terriglobus roseus]|nr:class I SAM-dependent methyltransferase [Terriglobus roseus]
MRTSAIDVLVNSFLDSDPGCRKQIVSLGAGSDTRYFRILASGRAKDLIYHELDFASNTSKKVSAIQKSPHLLALLAAARGESHQDGLGPGSGLTVSPAGDSLLSAAYTIHAIDLRSLAVSDSPLANLSQDSPTLILSECCLIYLSPSEADGVIRFFTKAIPEPASLSLVIYEPIRPNDPFGRVMISNLASRGIVLQTLKKYSSLSRQTLRLRAAGFTSGQRVADMDFLFTHWLDEPEKERISGIEMLDELEEWALLAQHYCVAWGWRDSNIAPAGIFSRAWGALEAQQPGTDDDEVG